jgi:hypothetical protein
VALTGIEPTAHSAEMAGTPNECALWRAQNSHWLPIYAGAGKSYRLQVTITGIPAMSLRWAVTSASGKGHRLAATHRIDRGDFPGPARSGAGGEQHHLRQRLGRRGLASSESAWLVPEP